VYLVSDEYAVEEEISARCSGAEMYFCNRCKNRGWPRQ